MTRAGTCLSSGRDAGVCERSSFDKNERDLPGSMNRVIEAGAHTHAEIKSIHRAGGSSAKRRPMDSAVRSENVCVDVKKMTVFKYGGGECAQPTFSKCKRTHDNCTHTHARSSGDKEVLLNAHAKSPLQLKVNTHTHAH